MKKAGYDESYRHDVLISAIKIFDKKIKDDEDGVCPLNRPAGYKVVERRKQKREKKRNWTGKNGRGGIPIIVPATENSSLMKEMRKVAENVRKENPDVNFSLVERGGISVERMIMKANPTESSKCGRNCNCCDQEGENKNMCRKSNVLYNWECKEKDVCPESSYDGQSSKNNYTRSGQHWTSYQNWVRYESGAINPKTGRNYAKPGTNSFLFDHQKEDHNGAPPNFNLQSKRFYGKDRLACQVAEAVALKMRKGKILNSKGDFHSPPLIEIQRNIRRGI